MGMNCLSKTLIGGLSITGALALTFIILYAVKDGGDSNDDEPSQANVISAARILDTMDQSADPCDDFWQYSCGGWLDSNVIPSSMGRLATFDACEDNLAVVLKKELENPRMIDDSSSIKKAKDFYTSCMDDATRQTTSEASMVQLVKDLGGWPIAGDAEIDGNNFDLVETLYKFATMANARPVINIVTAVDELVAINHLITVDQPGLLLGSTLNYEFQIEANKDINDSQKASIMNLKEAYIAYMTQFAMLYCNAAKNPSASCDSNQIRKDAEDVYALENVFASVMVSASQRSSDGDITFNKKTVKDFVDARPKSVGGVTKSLMAKLYTGTTTIEDDTIINDASAPYFDEMDAILADYTNLNAIQNMLVFRAMHPFVGALPDAYMAAEDIYIYARFGTTSRQDRYKTCIDMTNGALTFPVGAIYVEQAFAEESKNKISEMIGLVETIFKGPILDDADWMDDETKGKASIKADQVADFIGYPSYIVNDKPKMDDDYKDLSVNSDIFMNVVNAQNRAYDLDIKILPEDTDRERWSTGPAIVNAWYSPTRNTITFPAGILQAPFYDAGAPTATNYGAIGTVIGHELTHGFDDSGANYDGEGNKKNWWSDTSRENFNKNTQCMADQYSSYYWDEADMNVDGRSTLGENIADNGGIRESFFAYKEWRKDNKELRAPGLSSFSDEQLFFLGFSQVWCALYTPEEAANRVKTDVHSPNKFRVQGPLSNFEEFGKAFNCKQGQDRYYPNKEDTCQVW